MQALLSTLSWPSDRVERMLKSFLKLAALATVADVVPLTGENRVIVKHGLEGLNRVTNPGLKALFEAAGLERVSRPPPARSLSKSRRASTPLGVWTMLGK